MFGGLPVPGAVVTATQGDKRVSTAADLRGEYPLSDLAEGAWAIRVEILCFEAAEREVIVSAGAPVTRWEMKLLTFETIQASAVPAEPAASPAA